MMFIMKIFVLIDYILRKKFSFLLLLYEIFFISKRLQGKFFSKSIYAILNLVLLGKGNF